MSSISAKRLEKKDKKPIHLSFYPCLLIGRLASDNGFRKKGVGKYLAKWSTGLALDLSEHIGCRYVALETNDKKVNFYSKCGFAVGSTLEGDKHLWMYKKIAIV